MWFSTAPKRSARQLSRRAASPGPNRYRERQMICPRCGTVAAGQDDPCAPGAAASWIAARSRTPASPRCRGAPTYGRVGPGRAAGVVPQILARPKVAAPDGPPPRTGKPSPGPPLRPAPDGRRHQPLPSPTPRGGPGPPPPAGTCGGSPRTRARPAGPTPARSAHLSTPNPLADRHPALGRSGSPGVRPAAAHRIFRPRLQAARYGASRGRHRGQRPSGSGTRRPQANSVPIYLCGSPSPALCALRSFHGGGVAIVHAAHRSTDTSPGWGTMTGAVAGQPAGPDLVPGYRRSCSSPPGSL